MPTSGQVSLSNFYGASNSDPIPNAFAFTDISFNLPGGGGSGTTNTVTITGIVGTITLDFRTTNGSLGAGGSGFVVSNSLTSIYVNGNVVTPNGANQMSLFTPNNKTNMTQFQKITVSNNDTIYVEYAINVGGDDLDSAGGGGTWTVSNDSSGNTVLDTFTIFGSVIT